LATFIQSRAHPINAVAAVARQTRSGPQTLLLRAGFEGLVADSKRYRDELMAAAEMRDTSTPEMEAAA